MGIRVLHYYYTIKDGSEPANSFLILNRTVNDRSNLAHILFFNIFTKNVRYCALLYIIITLLIKLACSCSQAYIKKGCTPIQVFPVRNVYTNSFVFSSFICLRKEQRKCNIFNVLLQDVVNAS